MQSEEIRKRFIDFFVKRGHAHVKSSSLVPSDPSVLLTTAGMQQFKPYFTGELNAAKDFGSNSTASIQKSFRTSDVDEVGDNTHLTLFEMLGNFSFGYKLDLVPTGTAEGEPVSPKGGYWKKEAITYAFEFITQELGLPISYVTIFKGSESVPKDSESKEIWHSLGVTDVREEGIHDVFWGPTGSAGPCGPSTEIYCKNSEGKDVEIWNIVFNQFFYPGSREELLLGTSAKQLEPLPVRGIDTGAGFERVATIKQGVASVYETDIFADIMKKIAEIGPRPTGSAGLGASLDERTKRVIADHFRGASFLIADGVRPSNKEAGYILRRLLRRILAYKIQYDIHADIFAELLPIVQQKFADTYPELDNPEILKILHDEQTKFEKAVASGLEAIHALKASKMSAHPGGEGIVIPQLTGKEGFQISSTFGLGKDLIKEFSGRSLAVDFEKDFDEEFRRHQVISHAGSEKKFGGHGLILNTGELKAANEEELGKVLRLHTATHLTQQALRMVLGPEVKQAGSDITAERMRFDFSFPRKVTPEELRKVEEIINGVIAKDLPVGYQEMAKEDAAKTGALYFFKEKYPDKVKVYYVGHSIPDAFSKEFCGGPHVDHTGVIGKYRITKEESVGAGLRRIKAIVE